MQASSLPPLKVIPLSFILLACCGPLHGAEPLFAIHGEDPGFAEVMKTGKLPRGRNSTGGVTGSRVDVRNEAVEIMPEARRRIPQDLRIHTLGNSVIPRKDFGKWSRWYQEDGSTQVFRLFKGEENVRNNRKLAARVEAFSNVKWRRGEWHEWTGVYTIVKPHGAAIFQAKNPVNDWSVQLNMNDKGDVILNHRRGKDVVIATGMTGKPFLIRVRDNGHDYEVYLNGKLAGAGAFARPVGETGFRWGIYLGANEVKHDAMIFVSGATVDGR